MKTNVLTLTLFSLVILLFSCEVFDEQVKPSRDITTRSELFEEYNVIEASHAFQVYVTFSDTEEVIEIEANDNLHQYIEVEKVNNKLHIGLKNNVSVRGTATLNAYISTRFVDAYAASGASKIILESPLDAENMNINLSGASRFYGDIQTSDLFADVSGASKMNISGSSDFFHVEASGASVCKDYGFVTDNLHADISGASSIMLTVQNEIEVEASGASNLSYKGSGVVVYQDISGASSVKKVN
jgi:hypothetical protein